ncbi:MAG: hypothetical protein AB7P21_00020 [Lautropia sp.]
MEDDAAQALIDARVDRAFRDVSGEDPPPGIDRTILEAARIQATINRQRAGAGQAQRASAAPARRWQRLTGWTGAGSLAAALFAGVLVWRSGPEPLPEPVPPRTADEAAVPAPARQAPAQAQAPSSPAARSFESRERPGASAQMADRRSGAATSAPAGRESRAAGDAAAKAAAGSGTAGASSGAANSGAAGSGASGSGAADSGAADAGAAESGPADTADASNRPPDRARPSSAHSASERARTRQALAPPAAPRAEAPQAAAADPVGGEADRPETVAACIAALRRLVDVHGSEAAAAGSPDYRRLHERCSERFPGARWPSSLPPPAAPAPPGTPSPAPPAIQPTTRPPN